jgi:hypothetical protein
LKRKENNGSVTRGFGPDIPCPKCGSKASLLGRCIVCRSLIDSSPFEKEATKMARKKTETETEGASTAVAEQEVRVIPCDFGGVSFGEDTASISFTIDREQLDLQEADDILCGRRIQGRILVWPKGESIDQLHLFEDPKKMIAGSMDCKNFSVKQKKFSSRLTFALTSLDKDTEKLVHFAKRSGVLAIDFVDVIETADDDEAGDEEIEEE